MALTMFVDAQRGSGIYSVCCVRSGDPLLMSFPRRRAATIKLPGMSAMALVAALAACSATNDQAERETVVRAPLPAVVTGPVDGIYKGRANLVATIAPGCPDSTHGLLEIGDRKVVFPYNVDLTFISPVSVDGHVRAREGGYEFDGTLRDGHLDATISGAGCSTRMMFERLAYF